MGQATDCGIVGYAGSVTYLRLDPSLGPGPHWHRILPSCKGGHLVLDLGARGAHAAGSVQDILLLASMLQRREMRLWLSGLPPLIGRQLLEQRGVLPGVAALDLQVPYRCDPCGKLQVGNLAVDANLLAAAESSRPLLPERPCEICGGPMSAETEPLEVLGVLQHVEAVEPDASIRAEIELARADAENRDQGTGEPAAASPKHWWSGQAPFADTPTQAAVRSWRQLWLETSLAAILALADIAALLWLFRRAF